MKTVKVKNLKFGHGIYLPKYGYLQYRGMAKTHTYSNKIAIPYRYIFFQPHDEDGRCLVRIVVITNGNLLVEIQDEI